MSASSSTLPVTPEIPCSPPVRYRLSPEDTPSSPEDTPSSPGSPGSPEDNKKGLVPIHETPQIPAPPINYRKRILPLDFNKLDSPENSPVKRPVKRSYYEEEDSSDDEEYAAHQKAQLQAFLRNNPEPKKHFGVLVKEIPGYGFMYSWKE